MKVSYDFVSNKIVSSDEGSIELPNEGNFTLLAIKVIHVINPEWTNQFRLIPKDEEVIEWEDMALYYISNTPYENPYDEDVDPDLFEQYYQESTEEARRNPTFGVKDMKKEIGEFILGDYKVRYQKFIHAELDNYYDYRFQRM
jgi:hypothetical protein